MADKRVSEHLQRSIIIYSALGIFVIGVVVAFVSIIPLFNRLKENAEQNLSFAVKNRTLAVEEYLTRAKDVALQITSRTRIRDYLEAYNKGKIGLEELVNFTAPKLVDAMNLSAEVKGIARLDQEGNLVVQVGMPFPEEFWPLPGQDSKEAIIRDPIPVEGKSYLVVGAPILNNQSVRVGTDVVLFELGRLQQIIQDYTGLGETGETVLGIVQDDRVQLFFPLRGSKGAVPEGFPLDSPLGSAFEKASHQKVGILKSSDPPEVIAYGPIHGSDWGLLVKTDKGELYAPITQQAVAIGGIIGVLILLGTASTGILLRPLTRKMVGLEREIQAKASALESELNERKRAEEALRESEERYRSVFENAPFSIWMCDGEGTIIFANQAALDLFGVTAPDQIIGRYNIYRDTTEAEKSLLALFERAWAGEVVHYHQNLDMTMVKYATERQETLHFHSTLFPIPAGVDRRPNIVVVQENITERVRAEDALQQYTKRLEVLRKMDQGILGAQSPEALAQAAVEGIRRLVPCAWASVAAFDLETEEATVLAAHANHKTSVGAGARLPLEAFGITEELRQGRVQIVEETQPLSQPPPGVQALQTEGIRSYINVPLVVQDELLGALNLGSEEPGAFTKEQIQIAREVADQLAIAIRQGRLHEAVQQRVQELQAVHEAGRRLQRLHTPETLAQEIITVLEQALNYEYGAVLLVEEETGRLAPFALSDQGRGPAFVEADKAYVASHDIRVGMGITGWVAQIGRSLRVGDVRQDPHYHGMRKEIRSELCVPLRVGDRVIGVVNVETAKLNAYTEADQRVLETVAAQIAVAIQNVRLYKQVQRDAAELEQRVAEQTAELRVANEEIRQRADELTTLYEVSRELATTLDLETLLPVIAQQVKETLGADRCVVLLFDKRAGMLRAQAAHGYMAERFSDFSYRPGEEAVGQAYATGEPQYVPDLSLVPDLPQRNAIRAVLAVPLVSPTAGPLGVLSVASLQPEAFTPSQQRLLETMAGQIARVLENARLYEALQARSRELAARLEELEQQYRRQAALAEIELAINQPQELQAVLDRVAAVATELLPASGGASVVLWDANAEEFFISSSTVPGQEPQIAAQHVRRKGGATRWIVDHGKPLIVPDVREDPFAANRMLLEFDLQAYAGVPLLAEGKVLGVLYALDRHPRNYTQKDLRFMAALASRAATGINKVRLYERLQAAKERAEAADRLKSAFLATMSHELRTPLNSILGFTGILLQGLSGPLNAEQTKQLDMVRNSARHLLDLINDVLDISKIEAGQVKIISKPFDMREAIEKVVQTVTPLAEEKNLALTVDIGPEVGRITSDRRRVEQILINLLNNAVKFTDKGAVRVECQVNDGWLVTRVVDTGIGIKPEDMDKLFQAFRQVDTGLTRRYEGTGLGLSICKKLVKMLGGEIWAESEGLGKGSTFTFTLPIG
jgi:PAS domain S-box-containing protein